MPENAGYTGNATATNLGLGNVQGKAEDRALPFTLRLMILIKLTSKTNRKSIEILSGE